MRIQTSSIASWNDAGRPTGKQGLIGYNHESDQLEIHDGTSWQIYPLNRSKAITIEDPGSSEDITVFFTKNAITITQMNAVLIGSSTPSVTWTIRHHTDRTNAGNEVVTGGTTTTSVTTGDTITSFNDATIPANSFVWLETTAQSGTVTELHISIRFT